MGVEVAGFAGFAGFAGVKVGYKTLSFSLDHNSEAERRLSAEENKAAAP
jgi:hypothetical protein